MDAFESFTEDGAPLQLEHLPGRAVLRGETPDPLVVRGVRRDTGEERWRVIKARPVPGGFVVNVIEDITEVKRAEHTQRFLAQAGALMASSLDYEQTLNRIARLAVPRLADWCNVTMPRGDQPAERRARARRSREARARPRVPGALSDRDRRARCRAQVLGGRSLRVNHIDDAVLAAIVPDPEQRDGRAPPRPARVHGGPDARRGRPIGSITFVSAESGRSFSEDDLRLAEELGRRAGIAVENARLYRERSEIAATLQRGLLPDALPRIPGLRLSSLYRPAGAENLVGGDFYDAFPTDAGWMLLVGDVTGRGAAAAAETGQARHTLRTAGRLLSIPPPRCSSSTRPSPTGAS